MTHGPLRPDEVERLLKNLEAVELAETIALKIPQEGWDLRDQLRRAITSVALNTAEGAGEFSPADKARSHRMARRSATECIAILDVLERVSTAKISAAETRRSLDAAGAILTALILSMEKKRR